jgi:hypothetical protein
LFTRYISGRVQWVARAGSNTGNDVGFGIAVDSAGNVYVTGYYTGTMRFYNSSGSQFGTTLAQIAGNDMFIAKYIPPVMKFT